jgi:hypothetical protein
MWLCSWLCHLLRQVNTEGCGVTWFCSSMCLQE